MNDDRLVTLGRHCARIAVVIVGLFLGVAVGAPWLLYDAPPSPEMVFAGRLCCSAAPAATAPPAIVRAP